MHPLHSDLIDVHCFPMGQPGFPPETSPWTHTNSNGVHNSSRTDNVVHIVFPFLHMLLIFPDARSSGLKPCPSLKSLLPMEGERKAVATARL